MSRVVIYNVSGMTCKSCEKLIGNVLKDVPGVMEVEVSLKKEKAAVRVRDEARDPDLDQLNKELAVHGYALWHEDKPVVVAVGQGCEVPGLVKEPFSKRIRRALLALLFVGLAMFYVLSPLRDLLPAVDASASFGMLFLLGIVASVSTCLASTGGFMLAYSAEAKSRKRTLLMHAGRLVTFVLGGALLGLIGGALPHASVVWYGVLALILGFGFLGVALNLMELSPSLAKFGIALPSSLDKLGEKISQRKGSFTPFLIGAVTFVLPCGFTQTAQALALSSGSAAKGSLFMLAFALGTLPVLMGVTLFASRAVISSKMLRLAFGAVMFFFALGQIQSALNIFGVPLNVVPVKASSGSQVAQMRKSEQVIKMSVSASGYSPDTFTLVKGVPVRWEIDAKSAVGCTSSIMSRDLGISQNLNKGMNVIIFTPNKTGKIAFSCGMGMVGGTFEVVEKS
jgi:uncharacterized protein